jgi:hypothetical protein
MPPVSSGSYDQPSASTPSVNSRLFSNTLPGLTVRRMVSVDLVLNARQRIRTICLFLSGCEPGDPGQAGPLRNQVAEQKAVTGGQGRGFGAQALGSQTYFHKAC